MWNTIIKVKIILSLFFKFKSSYINTKFCFFGRGEKILVWNKLGWIKYFFIEVAFWGRGVFEYWIQSKKIIFFLAFICFRMSEMWRLLSFSTKYFFLSFCLIVYMYDVSMYLCFAGLRYPRQYKNRMCRKLVLVSTCLFFFVFFFFIKRKTD